MFRYWFCALAACRGELSERQDVAGGEGRTEKVRSDSIARTSLFEYLSLACGQSLATGYYKQGA